MPTGIYKHKKCTQATKDKISIANTLPSETRVCICGCEKSFVCKVASNQKYIHGHNSYGLKIKRETRICACGCKETFICTVTSKRKFIVGHNSRLQYKIPIEIRICECGCDISFECKITSKKRFISGHNPSWNIGLTKETSDGVKRATEKRSGENSNWWEGGLTSLGTLIRNTEEYKQWRKSVYDRDSYACVECGNGKKLNCHHIKSFSELLRDFLKEYDQFSPFEDKDTLVRLAIKWKPFWEIHNGKTLCKDCHELTDNYGWNQYHMSKNKV